jgi:hypothetical protein
VALSGVTLFLFIQRIFMSKVRITVPGWDRFTGLLGVIPFEDGVSTRELIPQEKSRLGAILGIEDVDGGQVGAGVDMAKIYNVSAEVKPVEPKPVAPKPEKVLQYNREKLEAIAEEGGIKAIREIAAKFDVKGVEISKIIDEVIEAQKKAD